MNDHELNMYNLLKRLLSKEELSGLSGIVIIEDGDNGYVLFNEYHIEKKKNMYHLTHFDTYLDLYFYSVRNAIIYATLDKRNKVMEAANVLSLDKLLEGALANLGLHSLLMEKSKIGTNKALYSAKLQEDKAKKRQILRQLDSYAREVKNWQFRRFEEAKK